MWIEFLLRLALMPAYSLANILSDKIASKQVRSFYSRYWKIRGPRSSAESTTELRQSTLWLRISLKDDYGY